MKRVLHNLYIKIGIYNTLIIINSIVIMFVSEGRALLD